MRLSILLPVRSGERTIERAPRSALSATSLGSGHGGWAKRDFEGLTARPIVRDKTSVS